MNNELPFKVKCVDATCHSRLTEGKQYEVEHIAYEIGAEYYQVRNDKGVLEFCDSGRFEVVTTPKDKQEFSVGDEVVINKISDDFVSFRDKNIKVGDVATVTMVVNEGKLNVLLENHNWVHGWWFSKSDLSLAEKLSDYHLLSHKEVAQAIIDGKELEMQYKTGKWVNVIPTNTTLHQLTTLNFRLKQSFYRDWETDRKSVV